MSSPLDNLEPRLIWKHFDDIRQIPRPSKHEERIRQHVTDWAASRGFQVVSDGVGNVVVRVPASPGRENAPTVVLQGHLDMVPEKNQDVEFDFLTDPIQVRVEGDYVYATGTTLGSDNGIGVAAAMAVAEDRDAVHGPLELLFTIDEETGLTGAQQLDASLIQGRILVNLDTEEDAALYIGCAGGADERITLHVTREPAHPGRVPLKISVRGLRGGHSGVDIHENRGNAVKFLARTLKHLAASGLDFQLASIDGGSKHNAIPRESDAVLFVQVGSESEVRRIASEAAEELAIEFGGIDPKQKIEITSANGNGPQPLISADRDRLLDALLACPHGVLAMSRAVAGLVETSNNLAVIETGEEKISLTTSSRSSVMPSLKATLQQVASVFRLAGADVHISDGYPAWTPNPDSKILKTTIAVFEREFGKTPEVKAIHAGLECGLIGEKFPGMDMVSMGPQIESPHSPDERVQISTVERFYRLLKATLAEIA